MKPPLNYHFPMAFIDTQTDHHPEANWEPSPRLVAEQPCVPALVKSVGTLGHGKVVKIGILLEIVG